MNNSGAIYVNSDDHRAVAASVAALLGNDGFTHVEQAPTAISGKLMIAEKKLRHFLIAPTHQGWVTVWEDPRYFADRRLARRLAEQFATEAVWMEVSGNGVSWARGHYAGAAVLDEYYDPVETTFYGEYGVVNFAFDIEQNPEAFIERLGLPYVDLHYEAILADGHTFGGRLIHLAFERDVQGGETA
jgi:hypothetical protein